jgi:hypothetical protein
MLCFSESSPMAAFSRVNKPLFLKKMYILLRKGAAMSNKEAFNQEVTLCGNSVWSNIVRAREFAKSNRTLRYCRDF